MLRIDRVDKSDKPKCEYCGSTEPADGFATKDVIHRGFDHIVRKQMVLTSTFTVCRGTPCGGNLQMAYEG
jgi:hypothetical protein